VATLTWDECQAAYKEGRPKLIALLGKLSPPVPLPDRQKFATAFSKAGKSSVATEQPGGGRPQPPSVELIVLDVPGRPFKELASDVKAYQAQVLRAGIPVREAGLFPPNDAFLATLGPLGWRPCTKGLPHKTRDGGFAFATAEGWVCGDGAIEHGMDLRWFIKEGFDDKTLIAAVRFSDEAMIGRGTQTSVHGGAVESCLDEATAELAKTKLFPMALTAKIEFKISKPVEPNVTYRVLCTIEKENAPGVSYEVKGVITSATNEKEVIATCMAKMANSAAF